MKAIRRVQERFILWSDNFIYQNKKIDLTPFIKRLDHKIYFKWKFHLNIIPFFRFLFKNPIKPEKEVEKIKLKIISLSQMKIDDKEMSKYENEIRCCFEFYISKKKK